VKLTDDLRAADGTALLHNVGYYTLNHVPSGPAASLTEAQTVKTNPRAHAGHAGMGGAAKPLATGPKRLSAQPADWGQPDLVITMGTRPGLKFDKETLQVKAGSKVKLVFNNQDDMTHNLVITSPGAVDAVGMAALKLGLKGPELHYVPDSPQVLFHTQLLQPESSETIYFMAPSTPGTYHYVCTYPGHAQAMRGVLRVVR
jgi:azurin